jgi:hypothetical protein
MAEVIDVELDGSTSQIITAVPEDIGQFPAVFITIHCRDLIRLNRTWRINWLQKAVSSWG